MLIGNVKKLKTLAQLASVVWLSSGSAIAMAQASADGIDQATDGSLSEIVVTAQKRAENLQKVPIAVTAIGGADLVSSNIDVAAGLQKVTPNLQIPTGGANFAPYLRGIGTTFSLPGLENSVALYFNDTYVSRPRSGFLTLADIARIEVLKGPQGTLYGRNATGGAIRVITFDPKNKWEGRVAATYGRFDRMTLDSMINVPITANLAARITYTHDEHDPYATNVNPGIRGQNDRNLDMVTAKLLWEPNDQLKIKLSGDYSNKKDSETSATVAYFDSPISLPQALGAAGPTGFYTSTEGISPRNEYLQRAGGLELRVDLDLDAFTLSSITSWRETNFDTKGDELDASILPIQALILFERDQTISQELQAVSDGNGPFKWTAGLYYFYEKADTRYDLYGTAINDAFGVPYGPNIGLPGGGAQFGSLSSVKTRSFAPYAQVSYDFTDALQLTVGARYSWEDKRFYNGSVIGSLDGTNYFTIADQPSVKQSIKRFTPKATVSFTPVDKVMFYATASRGFKSGGPNVPAFGAVEFVGPETLTAYELGWKTEFGNIRFNGSAFYYDYKDMQVSRVVNGSPAAQNAASARIYGIEADVTVAVSRNFDLGFGGGYLNTSYRKFLGDSYVPNASSPACAAALASASSADDVACFGVATVANTDLSGGTMTVAPKFSGYGRMQYTQPIGDQLGELVFNALISHRSKIKYSFDGFVGDNQLTLLSGGVSWNLPGERYSITVFGENLLAQRYRTTAAVTALGGYYVPGDPRTWGVRVAAKF